MKSKWRRKEDKAEKNDKPKSSLVACYAHKHVYCIYFFILDGFKKMVATDQGGIRPEKDEWEFHHQNFIQGKKEMLELVKRKVRKNSYWACIFCQTTALVKPGFHI